jgi:hypothetical protein
MGQQKCEKHLTKNGVSTLRGVMLAHLSDYLHMIFLNILGIFHLNIGKNQIEPNKMLQFVIMKIFVLKNLSQNMSCLKNLLTNKNVTVLMNAFEYSIFINFISNYNTCLL